MGGWTSSCPRSGSSWSLPGDRGQVDGVKLASGRAHAAADAAVGIDDAHAAAKAAGRFHFDLLFCECAARVTERLACLRTGERCGHLTRRSIEALCRQSNIALVQFGVRAAVTADRQALTLVYIAV